MYYFDLFGWLTATPLEGRCTEVEPPIETEALKANWTGSEWVLREYTPPPEIAPPPAVPRLITVGAFFDRFGPLKWAILADQSPMVQAVIRDATVRKHIDLDNPDLPAGLAIITSAGHSIDANAVISSPVQPHEAP